ncbi:MAG TPA: prepilin peptidase [Thermodesulfovibrionales bacterium]|nr:prepilin peptidase [Thermodesulfovibrionales bacterium]
MSDFIPYIIIFVIGAVIGSFLNVCIYRVPRNLSIISPASRCPSCNMPIKPYDNIPFLSYILLGGKCRVCKAGISFRYPLVELLNAVLFVFVVWRFGFAWHTVIYGILCSALVVITFIDLDFQIIPDAITLPGILIGIVAGSLLMPDPFIRTSLLGFKASVIGLLAGGGLFYAIAVLSRGGMGGGDIKMMAMVGALMGWKSVLLTIFLGSLTGAVFGIFLMISKGKGRKTKIPFGPFLALGTVITLFYGQEIFSWYFYR